MITAAVLQAIPLFSPLSEEQCARIASHAHDLTLKAGDWLMQEGEVPLFYVILSGQLAAYKRFSCTDRVVNHFGPGEFVGEVPLLLGSGFLVSVRARECVQLICFDANSFYAEIIGQPELSATILKVMWERLRKLQVLTLDKQPESVTVVGDRWALSCHETRVLLSRNHVPYRWIEPAEGGTRFGLTREEIDNNCPIVILSDGKRLYAPSVRELAEGVGLHTRASKTCYDLGIVGAGPAGLSAAVYGASEGLNTIVFERDAPGGQAGTSSRIQNYLGFPAGLSGDELSHRALQQAVSFGAEIVVAREVTGLRTASDGSYHTVILDNEDAVECRTVVLTAGISWRRLDAKNLPNLLGKGVYYGCAYTDAFDCRDKDVYVVGGGNSAGQAAMMLSGYARNVTIVIRAPSLTASMSRYLIDQIAMRPNIRVESETTVVEVDGDEHLATIHLSHGGQVQQRPADMLFILIGANARTDWLPATVQCDDLGYVLTGRDVDRATAPQARYLLETSVPGVFAAGDIRHDSMKRVASSVGEGSMAIAFVHRYLGNLNAISSEVVRQR